MIPRSATERKGTRPSRRSPSLPLRRLALIGISALALVGAAAAREAHSGADDAATVEDTRIALGKWIETQQIISKERKDWQQGREILLGRLDLVKEEIASLEERMAQAETAAAESLRKVDELTAENDLLKAATGRLAEALAVMEGEIRRLFTSLPESVQAKLQPVYQRIPEDPAQTRASAAERFQNVLVILNELNRVHNDITVQYEVRTLADGTPAEVKAIYVGLAQAYYISARGEAGIGRPTPEGWTWQPSKAVANDVLKALEILEGKHTPAFVSLPATLQFQ